MKQSFLTRLSNYEASTPLIINTMPVAVGF